MKKLLFIAVILAAGFSAQAQSPGHSGKSTPYISTLDTVTDTGNDTLYTNIAGVKNSVTFQYQFKKISGDPSGVILKVFASASGTTDYKAAPLLSVTMPNGDTTVQLTITGNPYTNYTRILDGAGTQVSSVRSWLNIR